MPRYYFHVRDSAYRPDREGTELPGITAARSEAARLVGELLRDHQGRSWNGFQWEIQVTDETASTLLTLQITAVDTSA